MAFFIISNKGNISPTQKNNITQTKSTENKTSEPVMVVTDNLDTPWSIAFLPDKSMLVSQRNGIVFHISKDGNEEKVGEIPSVKEYGEGGLMGVAVHPNFSVNSYVYFYYTYSENGVNTLNRVVRMGYKNNRLENEQIVVDKIPGGIFHNGGRIKFGPDGFLYITTGDATNPSLSQNKDSLAGKILRVTDDGKPAPGNPFKTQVYSFGHRNPQGLAWDLDKHLWETEHGPSGTWPNCCQDEINVIEAGKNYGWPENVGDNVKSGVEAAVLHSGREIWAPAGLDYLNGSLFFAGLRGEALYEYKIATKRLTAHFKNTFGRIRDVVVGPDNMIYITTSNLDGRGLPKRGDDKIIKINPGKL